MSQPKPTEPQAAALRYYLAETQEERIKALSAWTHGSPTLTQRALVARGWLEPATAPDWRWKVTPAGRAALRRAT